MVVTYRGQTFFRHAPRGKDDIIQDTPLSDDECVKLAKDLLNAVGKSGAKNEATVGYTRKAEPLYEPKMREGGVV